MDWRRKLQVKEDRGHFGLAWSVLAAYAIAFAVLVDGWHPRARGMIDFHFVALIVFMVVGGFGVYLALASAMRWWPHNPRKRDIERVREVTALYVDGKGLFDRWGESAVKRQVLAHERKFDDEALKPYDSGFSEMVLEIIEWRKRADESISDWFGAKARRAFITEPEISSVPPDWQRGDQWFTNLYEIAGRLTWLRRWLREQDDL